MLQADIKRAQPPWKSQPAPKYILKHRIVHSLWQVVQTFPLFFCQCVTAKGMQGITFQCK